MSQAAGRAWGRGAVLRCPSVSSYPSPGAPEDEPPTHTEAFAVSSFWVFAFNILLDVLVFLSISVLTLPPKLQSTGGKTKGQLNRLEGAVTVVWGGDEGVALLEGQGN